ncbi:MAG: ABC transporter ATP-binding protein [Planctomycetota bacterium]|nr:ABC transporter ATP-binding protein [Planctomycetota bacterium]
MNIELQNISKTYGRQTGLAVNDVSLAIPSGELFFLLGPSGCGKTTLLRILAGLLEASAGRVLFDGRDVSASPPERRGTAMVFQSYALWPHMTVQQNVEFGPRMQHAPAADRRRRAKDALDRVRMADLASRRPNQLSGGQQQRVALARALAAGTQCLLLDEPLSNLDARLRLAMRTELRQLVKDAGITAVYVTHDQVEALSMADRVALMNAGRIAQLGRPADLYERPADRFVADFLGEANFIRGHLVSSADPIAVDTPLGQLPAASCAGALQGQAVTCCIRPERFLLSPAPQALPLQATVAQCTYVGEAWHLLCRSGETLLKVKTPPGPMPQLGDVLTLYVAPDGVTILKD